MDAEAIALQDGCPTRTVAKDEFVRLKERWPVFSAHVWCGRESSIGCPFSLWAGRGSDQGRNLLPGKRRASELHQTGGELVQGAIRQECAPKADCQRHWGILAGDKRRCQAE
jgi:hypothetical protein